MKHLSLSVLAIATLVIGTACDRHDPAITYPGYTATQAAKAEKQEETTRPDPSPKEFFPGRNIE